MKLGIIGAGAIGKKHAQAAQTAGIPIGMVVDSNQEIGRAFAEEFKTTHALAPEALYQDGSIDAVVIGIPNWLHQSFAIAALRAGKHVLLEKPMALSYEQCEEIDHVAQAAERVLQVGFVHRFTGVAEAAKKIIESGALGDLYFAQAFLFLRRNVPGLGRWFTDRERSGGGAVIDVGVHLLDLALYGFNFPPVQEVAGQTFQHFGVRMEDYKYEDMWSGPPDYSGVCNVEDAAQAMVKLAGGKTLDFHVAWAGNYPQGLMPPSMVSFCGTKGGIAFELFGDKIHQTTEREQLHDEVIPVEENDFFLKQLLDFQENIESRTSVGANCHEASEVQAIVDAIYASSQQDDSPQKDSPTNLFESLPSISVE
ncbi:MAG: Gfo/Idh/MocA family oxidoreductase [Lacipirellulaceae bacterium]